MPCPLHVALCGPLFWRQGLGLAKFAGRLVQGFGLALHTSNVASGGEAPINTAEIAIPSDSRWGGS